MKSFLKKQKEKITRPKEENYPSYIRTLLSLNLILILLFFFREGKGLEGFSSVKTVFLIAFFLYAVLISLPGIFYLKNKTFKGGRVWILTLFLLLPFVLIPLLAFF